MFTGSCLCGEVAFEFTTFDAGINLCHCSVCRTITGSAYGATLRAHVDGFRWTRGHERLKTWAKPTGLSVSFCSNCGTHMPDAEACGPIYPVPAGTLDVAPDTPVRGHIFVGSKAAWEEIGGEAPQWEHDEPLS